VVDRRLDCRYGVRLASTARAVYQLDDVGREQLLLIDVSLGGCQVKTGKVVPAQRLVIDLPVLGERRIEVCWVKGRRAGCRFIEPLTTDELRRIIEAGRPEHDEGVPTPLA
jgi:hypothetical protein